MIALEINFSLGSLAGTLALSNSVITPKGSGGIKQIPDIKGFFIVYNKMYIICIYIRTEELVSYLVFLL